MEETIQQFLVEATQHTRYQYFRTNTNQFDSRAIYTAENSYYVAFHCMNVMYLHKNSAISLEIRLGRLFIGTTSFSQGMKHSIGLCVTFHVMPLPIEV